MPDLIAGLESIKPLRGEWKMACKRVKKGSGMIEGVKVDVYSIFDHPDKVDSHSVACADFRCLRNYVAPLSLYPHLVSALSNPACTCVCGSSVYPRLQ